MRTLVSFGNKLYSVLGDKVVCINTTNGAIELEFNFAEGHSHTITYILLSEDGSKIFVCYTNKWVVCFATSDGSVQGKSLMKKRPVAVSHGKYAHSTNDATSAAIGEELREVLVIVDINGDIWAVRSPQMDRPPVYCGGHTTSVITDLKLHQKYILSSDRDEKIRITNFPSMVKVHSYCLGHTSVITSIATIDFSQKADDFAIVSTGWDRNIIAWNCNGEILGRYLIEDSSIVDDDEAAHVAASSMAIDGTDQNVLSAQGGGSAESNSSNSNNNNSSNNNDDEGEENEDEKFNESKAGSYPLKLIHFRAGTAGTAGSHYLAIIFRNVSELQIFEFRKESSTSGLSTAVKISHKATVELPAVPADIYAIDGAHLVISFPGPRYFAAIPINADGFLDSFASILGDSTSNTSSQIVTQLNDYSSRNNVQFSQIWSDSSSGQFKSEDRGLKKHALDDYRRYNKDEHRKGIKKPQTDV